jgi:hypothetical protein
MFFCPNMLHGVQGKTNFMIIHLPVRYLELIDPRYNAIRHMYCTHIQ